MRLTFWHIQCEQDSSAYSIRTKTKREALELYHADEWNQYSNILERITLEYQDGFDLFDATCSEWGWHGLVVEKREYKIS